jgi:hypothetical protein
MPEIPGDNRYRGAVFDPAAPTADYALTWPRPVFRAEARDLVRRADGSAQWSVEAEWLLEDAFAGDAPVRDLKDATSGRVLTAHQSHAAATAPANVPSEAAALQAAMAGLAAMGKLSGEPRRQYLQYLVAVTDRLPEHGEPAYWSARRDSSVDARLQQIQGRWAGLVGELQRKGYLARVAPRPCTRAVDTEPPPDYWLNQETWRRLGLQDVWPLRPGDWAREAFLDLVELVHDLVARPGRRIVHNHRDDDGSWCGWHFDRYSVQTGQAVYRWQVDRLFAAYRTGLRFAEDGDDRGRLIHVTGDDRDELVRRVLATPQAVDSEAVGHAVTLFRGRAASREDKRSAVVALARILEDRRRLLQAELLSNDEGALFQIANQFDIRHRRANQRPDYDEAYLDWIFWWYLATIELTDQLRGRQP